MYTAEEHKIVAKLRGNGIHITKSRVTVFKMLCRHKDTLSVSYINKYFSGSVNRVCVYRALKVFLQKGLLTKVPNAAGETKYILSINEKTGANNSKIQVAYFVCTSCERMTVLDETVFCPFKLPENLKVKHCHVLIEGVCTKCDGGLHI